MGGKNPRGNGAPTPVYQCSCGKTFTGFTAKARAMRHAATASGNHIPKKVR